MDCRTILVADDDPGVRAALRVRLTALGYRVIECSDGLEVIAKVRAVPVAAIVLDHGMPLGEGRTIAPNLRDCTDAPIIFVSGSSSDEFAETVRRLPETYYLRKPLDTEKLARLLAATVAADAAVR